MSRSRVEAKRAERRQWSNHKAYLRRRGMKAPERPKAYTMVPFAAQPLDHKPVAADPKATKRVGFFARLWRWVRGKP